ncbi:hypothetical protein CC78DRAFT_537630 [Lojkania enalia]|uniref:Uncharacterized protein n=1 Tax=Lojkania enalia TaxID=147567 RepID=A0A9P4K1W0_9PLEO|nr:hypothetical protein CC78DRAFT_537630 [Didymosphaeria enalia]
MGSNSPEPVYIPFQYLLKHLIDWHQVGLLRNLDPDQHPRWKITLDELRDSETSIESLNGWEFASLLEPGFSTRYLGSFLHEVQFGESSSMNSNRFPFLKPTSRSTVTPLSRKPADPNALYSHRFTNEYKLGYIPDLNGPFKSDSVNDKPKADELAKEANAKSKDLPKLSILAARTWKKFVRSRSSTWCKWVLGILIASAIIGALVVVLFLKIGSRRDKYNQ